MMEQSGVSRSWEDRANLVIDLDPHEAARKRAQRAYRLNAIHIPLLRLLGLSAVSLMVFLHGLWVLPSEVGAHAGSFFCLVLLYCGISWAILYGWYHRLRTWDLGIVFLVVDLAVFIAAIYASGGEKSWLFFLIMVHVAGQAGTTFKRAFLFTHLAPLSYVCLLGYLYYGEQRPLPWGTEGTKLFSIYVINLYLSLTARATEALRNRTVAAIRVARESIVQHQEKSAQLEVARQQAEDASRAKSAFLANMSHELRTPLHAILGYSELLQRKAVEQDRPGLATDVRKIHTAGQHLLTLINDVLDLSKIEAGRMELRCESFTIPDFLNDVVQTIQPLASTNANQLEVRIAPALGTMYSDRTRLRQSVLNLLSNACKFTTAGVLTLDVSQDTTDEGEWLQIVVADTGIGIPPEQMDKLFKPFSQVDASMTRHYGGTGLGLAISQHFCQMLGGSIQAASVVGQGSRFTLRVPMDSSGAPYTL